MKRSSARLLLLAVAAISLLSGCVVADPHPYHDGPHRTDRDHDGVPNRYDARPNDPTRY